MSTTTAPSLLKQYFTPNEAPAEWSSGKKAVAYAADAALQVATAAAPEWTIGLTALSLCVPVIGPALAPAAFIGGAMADAVQLVTAPLFVPRALALSAWYGAKALLGK